MEQPGTSFFFWRVLLYGVYVSLNNEAFEFYHYMQDFSLRLVSASHTRVRGHCPVNTTIMRFKLVWFFFRLE